MAECDLVTLAIKHKTDKWNTHYYAKHYEHHFRDLRHAPLKILEIGVGGWDLPTEGGASLRMWKEYFPNALIFGIDVYDKKGLEEERLRIFQGDQANPAFLLSVANSIGPPDIIIDDGSHLNEQVAITFRTLFPLMSPQGIYAIEDVQTSFIPAYGGNPFDLNDSRTTMGMAKQLLNGLNYEEFPLPEYRPTYFDLHIVGMHFYHNLIIINKGLNNGIRSANTV